MLIDLDVNLDLLSVAANHSEVFLRILIADWLPLKLRQD